MTDQCPKISVWMTCRNQELYIREAVDSVLNQTLRPCEILISDDCSTDGTRKILEEYARCHPGWIKVYYQSERLGITRNKNFIARKAQGDFLTWLDGDDRFHPQKLEKEMEYFQRQPEAKIVFSNVNRIDRKSEVTGTWVSEEAVRSALREKIKSPFLPVSCYPEILYVRKKFAHLRNELIRREVFESIGLYDEKIILWQDYEHRIRQFAKFKALYCPLTLQDYRDYPGSSRYSGNGCHGEDLAYIYRKHCAIVRNPRVKWDWYSMFRGLKKDKKFLAELGFSKQYIWLGFLTCLPRHAAGSVERMAKYLAKKKEAKE